MMAAPAFRSCRAGPAGPALARPEATAPLAPLAAFLATHNADGVDALAAAIRAECEAGGGVWMEPETTGLRPGTHLYEIALHGVSATGECLPQAVANWRTVARRRLAAGGAA